MDYLSKRALETADQRLVGDVVHFTRLEGSERCYVDDIGTIRSIKSHSDGKLKFVIEHDCGLGYIIYTKTSYNGLIPVDSPQGDPTWTYKTY